MMKKSISELVNKLRETFTPQTKAFLDRAQPSYGNILKNTKKSSPYEPDVVGFAKLDDGTAVRIEGIYKENGQGQKYIPIRIFKVPITLYDDKGMIEVESDPWP